MLLKWLHLKTFSDVDYSVYQLQLQPESHQFDLVVGITLALSYMIRWLNPSSLPAPRVKYDIFQKFSNWSSFAIDQYSFAGWKEWTEIETSNCYLAQFATRWHLSCPWDRLQSVLLPTRSFYLCSQYCAANHLSKVHDQFASIVLQIPPWVSLRLCYFIVHLSWCCWNSRMDFGSSISSKAFLLISSFKFTQSN